MDPESDMTLNRSNEGHDKFLIVPSTLNGCLYHMGDKNVPRVRIDRGALSCLTLSDLDDDTMAFATAA